VGILSRLPVGKLGNVAEYHVENFGCRASRSDGEAIASGLRVIGFVPAAEANSAHIVIVNTCSVTAEADRSARAFVRRVRRQNPAARVVVTGCYAQRAPFEVARLEGVDAVVGNSHKALIQKIAVDLAGSGRGRSANFVPLAELSEQGAGEKLVPGWSGLMRVDEHFAHAELARLPFAADARQTRPNLKVQDGCANRCSFCVIPATRGPSRSSGMDACLADVRRFVARGGKELVLSGINLGRWGMDLVPARRLDELIGTILTETELPRLRLSSIEPMDWTPELLTLFAQYATGDDPRLAPHAHLPLQSGSDAILRRMHRRYRPWHYTERVARIRELMPDAAIGADVMVGFPGESDELFEESYRFIEAQPFTYLHLFPFSARPGTAAWELNREQPVNAAAIAERMAALRGLSETKSREFRERFIGRTLSVVTLERGGSAGTPAMAANFVKVELDEELGSNQMLTVRVSDWSSAGDWSSSGGSSNAGLRGSRS
jgi:threonylcarbamoyladenosine tRNA methylthiotransferase MtaB